MISTSETSSGGTQVVSRCTRQCQSRHAHSGGTPLVSFSCNFIFSYSTTLVPPILFLQTINTTDEEKFKKLVREMHRHIKACHHLNNVHISDGTTQEPAGMVRTMRRLQSVIKPAVPTATTNLMLYGLGSQTGVRELRSGHAPLFNR